ncbi:2Fe-2S iron-sulfur cluster binding domain-containing protein [Pseudenhygromyxa sp. WMMC2535]|nr:2Fe-2S iron-sulfur cluster binding domain-containing protein [Pseudenhygromyxa sp. WMMC2535]NVB36286.1 2Fe-2S iron-sulfur cluster binding domain-containing protein [Pseudenhygromyxa sp. WMMC2535]
MVVSGLRGERAPSWQPRDASRYARQDARGGELAAPPREGGASRSTADDHGPGRSQTARAWPLTVVLEYAGRSREVEVIVAPGERLLDAGLDAGLPLSFSCTMGGCGACMVELEAGEVALDEPNCLDREERAAGKILACVAQPLSPCRIRARLPEPR